MNPMILVALNCLVAGTIAGAGVLMGSAMSGQPVSQTVIIVAVCTGLISAGKDWLSRMATPPTEITTTRTEVRVEPVPIKPPVPPVAGVLLLCLLLSACSGLGVLQNPATETKQQLAIMSQQNARGCVYFKGNAQPWANVTTLIIGTWGQSPPTYAECWQGLPAGMP